MPAHHLITLDPRSFENAALEVPAALSGLISTSDAGEAGQVAKYLLRPHADRLSLNERFLAERLWLERLTPAELAGLIQAIGHVRLFPYQIERRARRLEHLFEAHLGLWRSAGGLQGPMTALRPEIARRNPRSGMKVAQLLVDRLPPASIARLAGCSIATVHRTRETIHRLAHRSAPSPPIVALSRFLAAISRLHRRPERSILTGRPIM